MRATMPLDKLAECPPRHVVRHYYMGELSDRETIACENHLNECASCEETLRDLFGGQQPADESRLLRQLGQFAHPADGLAGKLTNSASESESKLVASLVENMANQVMEPCPLGQAKSGKPEATINSNVNPIELDADAAKRRASLAERSREIAPYLLDEPNSLGRLAHYQLVELIGCGATGIVYRATDEQLNRQVVLKILRPSLGPNARSRFLDEARSAASIEHANVVTIYQVGEAQELAFLAMQWIDGRTLECRLQDEGPLDEAAARRIGAQIAAGLQAAHDRNLIHRDIKPANIWLSDSDQQATILDFGLARAIDDDPEMTSAGMLAGTPNYMSPEQSRGMELDGRSDLFSLGCTLYQSVTSQLPFGGKGILATLQSIQHDRPPVPLGLNANITQEFSDLLMCLLEKQANNRPDSASDLEHALNNDRNLWAFNTARYTATPTVSDMLAEKPATGAALSKPSFLGGTRRATAIALLMLLPLFFATFMFGDDVYRIVTNQGELLIETSDPNIQIQVLDSGKVVKVIDGTAKRSVDIRSGEYTIRAIPGSGASETKDDDTRFVISPNKIQIRRGGQQVVQISRLPVDPKTGNAGSSNSENDAADSADQTATAGLGALNPNDHARAEMLYDGKTFAQWQDQIRRERKPEAVQEAVMALSLLASHETTLVAPAIDTIRPLIRQHGSQFIGSTPDWNQTFINAFGNLPVADRLAFAIDEINTGTTASRKFNFWLLQRYFLLQTGRIEETDSRLQLEHERAIRTELAKILETGFQALQRDDLDADSRTAIRASMDTALSSCFDEFESVGMLNQLKKRGPLDSAIEQIMARTLEATDSKELQYWITTKLVQYGKTDAVLLKQLGEYTVDPEIPTDMRTYVFASVLPELPDERFGELVWVLRQVFESEALCDSLISQHRPIFWSQGKLISSGFGGGGFVDSENAVFPWFQGLGDRLSVRTVILKFIQERARYARTAIGWMDELGSSNSELAELAGEVADSIRQNAPWF